MESIASGAVAGLIAALVATAILGFANFVRQWLGRRQDVGLIRDIFIQGRMRVMDAEDTFHEGMGLTMSAGALRAGQYNNMIRQVDVALERRTQFLSHDQKNDVYDALDWYHTDSLNAVRTNGGWKFLEIPDGRWPTTEMSMEAAKSKFEKLRSIEWLKCEAD